MIQGLDRTDRAALGFLLLVWEPLLILSIVAACAFLVWMINYVRRHGPSDIFTWVLFAFTIASFFGAYVGADHIGQTLGASTSTR